MSGVGERHCQDGHALWRALCLQHGLIGSESVTKFRRIKFCLKLKCVMSLGENESRAVKASPRVMS